MEQKVLRTGTLVVVGALLLRLASGFLPGLFPHAASVIFFLQTGRIVHPVRISFTPGETQATEATPPPTEPVLPVPKPEPELPVFSESDAAQLAINCGFSYSADIPALLTKPLNWNLTGDAPTVLIVHSHGSESYAPTGEYTEVSPYHTLNNTYNMISIGEAIARQLEAAGITVVHDTTLHDNPSYNDS